MSHRGYKLVSFVVLLVSTVFAQDSPPLGDVAREARAQRARSAESDMAVARASASLVEKTRSFSADFTNTDASGKATGRLYFSAPRMREETVSLAGAANNADGKVLETFNFTYIIDGATRTTYVLMPQFQHTYLLFNDNARPRFVAADLDFLQLISGAMANLCAETGTNCKNLGAETLSGRPCEVWEVTDQRTGKSMSLWLDERLHFPVRIHVANGSLIEFTNIREGPQDASLFTVPADYKPFDPSLFGKHAAEKNSP